VGGTRQRRFAGISLKPHKLPENAQTPTSRVHAVLGAALQAIAYIIDFFLSSYVLHSIENYSFCNFPDHVY
jgi:hypothetical protein